jgi:hypothetical protein
MTDIKTTQQFFSESEWDLIYEVVGNALDNDNYYSEEVYSIRAKIHNLFLPVTI